MLINFKQATKIKPITQKSHTCGANFRICLAFIYELEKQLFIKKNC